METTRKDKIWRSKLTKKLLSIGGSKVISSKCETWNDFPAIVCKYIIEEGELFKDMKIVYRLGANSRCHFNVLFEAGGHPGYIPYFGFGLSGDDGMWRPHSWLISNRGNIIETTVSRIAYFGVIIPFEEVENFYKKLESGEPVNWYPGRG